MHCDRDFQAPRKLNRAEMPVDKEMRNRQRRIMAPSKVPIFLGIVIAISLCAHAQQAEIIRDPSIDFRPASGEIDEIKRALSITNFFEITFSRDLLFMSADGPRTIRIGTMEAIEIPAPRAFFYMCKDGPDFRFARFSKMPIDVAKELTSKNCLGAGGKNGDIYWLFAPPNSLFFYQFENPMANDPKNAPPYSQAQAMRSLAELVKNRGIRLSAPAQAKPGKAEDTAFTMEYNDERAEFEVDAVGNLLRVATILPGSNEWETVFSPEASIRSRSFRHYLREKDQRILETAYEISLFSANSSKPVVPKFNSTSFANKTTTFFAYKNGILRFLAARDGKTEWLPVGPAID